MMRPVPGGEFILDQPDEIPAIWGEGTQVLMAEGEALLIVASPGVGKTTLAGQLALRRAGIPGFLGPDLLGLPVEPDTERKLLYIAADRPRQIARSFKRMVGPGHRLQLDAALVFWGGPLPFDIVEEPQQLVTFAQAHGAGTVVIDSLGDIASPLSEDRVGSRVKLALAYVVAAGIEVVALHHVRKETSDGRKPRSLSDVYGSQWITAGVGSVVFLYGEAGDPVVELLHLKQPADVVGPLELIHDHDHGVTCVAEQTTVYDLVRRATNGGVTVKDVAAHLSGKADPSRNHIEKARRKLAALVRDEHAVKIPGEAGEPDVYRPIHRQTNGSVRDPRDPSVTPHVTPSRNGHAGHDLAQGLVTQGSRAPDSTAPPIGGEPCVTHERDPHLSLVEAEEQDRADALEARYGDAA